MGQGQGFIHPFYSGASTVQASFLDLLAEGSGVGRAVRDKTFMQKVERAEESWEKEEEMT